MSAVVDPRPMNRTDRPEYMAWLAMRKRCEYRRDISYRNYGGRGISVCARWGRSFDDFFADVGPRPGPSYSLDRIDNNGNYCPGNVRWATSSAQGRNRRNNRLLVVDGKNKVFAEAIERSPVSRQVVDARLRRGWAVHRALSEPLKFPKDLAGAKIGRLTVIAALKIDGPRGVVWSCLCDCGASHAASTGNLRAGRVRSCGCLKREESARRLRENNPRKKAQVFGR